MTTDVATVRPFRRDDRDPLTRLVNAHIDAVTPGAAISVNRLLSHLESEPGEFIVDRWVAARTTLVAEQRGRLVAAAHLLRYRADAEVGPTYRDAGEVNWLVCWPDAPFWPGSQAAGAHLLAQSVDYLKHSGAASILADGSLPAPAVFGIPDAWPHIERLLLDAGFGPTGAAETVHLAALAGLPTASAAGADIAMRRSLGTNGTRFTAEVGGRSIGYIEVDWCRSDVGRMPGDVGWADIGNLHVAEEWRRRGVGRRLLGEATDWLRLGGGRYLVAYTGDDAPDETAFLAAAGFRPITRVSRGWLLGGR